MCSLNSKWFIVSAPIFFMFSHRPYLSVLTVFSKLSSEFVLLSSTYCTYRYISIVTSVFCFAHTKVEWCLGSPLQLDWEQMEPTTGIKSGLMLLDLSWDPLSDLTPAPLITSWICWQSKKNSK